MSEASAAVVANGTSAAPAPAARPLDDEGKKLFDTYQVTCTNLKKVKKAEDMLTSQKNATVKAIFEKYGKGPFPTPEGDQIIVARGETFYFKTAYKKGGGAEA